MKKKKGRLKIDSRRILEQPGWTDNVIDIDTYGSPWNHWDGVLRHAPGPTTVFLTIGQVATGTVGSLSNAALEALGLGPLAKQLPKAFHVKLSDASVRYSLARAHDAGKRIVEAVESVSHGNARYIGVRLESA